MKGVENMAEGERGGFFGFGSSWIWIVIIIIVIILIFPGIFGEEHEHHDNCFKG
jgi:hypothetical protein